MIEVKNLTKIYGDHAAIDNLSFSVDDGMIYGFLGPNGAGKSTTMNIMTGYLAPTSGDVLINGYNILDEPEKAKETIGYLPELPPVYTDMTVLEYLTFCAELKKVKKGERKKQVKEVMDSLEITDMQNRLIRNLSKGYRQRVGFAQALLGHPKTLILDEPTVGLDPKQIIEIRSLIKALGEKHTVILSSHILSEVSEVCDKVLIINHGKFVALDTPGNLSSGQKAGSVLLIAAEGDAKTVFAAVSSVCAVKKEDIRTEGKIVRLRIPVPAGKDIRASLSEALFSAGCPVIEMKTEKTSLEDIFLQLTEDSQPSEDGAVSAEEPDTGDETDSAKKMASGDEETSGKPGTDKKEGEA